MNTEEVATKLVEYCRNGKWLNAIDDLYSKDIVSVEARAMEGISAPRSKERVARSVGWQSVRVAAAVSAACVSAFEIRASATQGRFRADQRWQIARSTCTRYARANVLKVTINPTGEDHGAFGKRGFR